MQALARDGLTTEQVTELLQAPTLEISAGCELLNPDLSLREDISEDLLGGSVERNLYDSIHGLCSLQLTRALSWGIDLVRPYMTLTDGTHTARFNVGVYALTTPESTYGEDVLTYDVRGFDRIYLLRREVGADYTATAGTTYRQALQDVFTAAGLTGVLIEGSAADNTLPVAKTWPLVGKSDDPDQTDTPVTWLRIVNDLLRAINFRGVWADDNGLYRCEAYQDPTSRPPEFAFDADDLTSGVVGELRTVAADVWAAPNRWVFRQTNRDSGAPVASEGDGIYTVDLSDTVGGDWLGRTLVWTSVIDYEAASQAKLVDLGDRRVALDRRLTSKIRLTTGPFPCAGHADLFTYTDASAGGSFRVQASRWSFDLSGSDVAWEWEVVA